MIVLACERGGWASPNFELNALGTILGVRGSGAAQKLDIRFERVGVKTVVLRYVDLEFG